MFPDTPESRRYPVGYLTLGEGVCTQVQYWGRGGEANPLPARVLHIRHQAFLVFAANFLLEPKDLN